MINTIFLVVAALLAAAFTFWFGYYTKKHDSKYDNENIKSLKQEKANDK